MDNASQATGFPPQRRATQAVHVGEVTIGGGAPVSVQTMTKTDTADAEATLRQTRAAAAAGAQVVRVAIPSHQALDGFAQIVADSPVPIVADIHFDYRLALAAIERGAAKIRINPGNIGDDSRLGAVLDAAGEAGIPVRLGINAGSLEQDLLDKYGHPTAEALCESAFRSIQRAEKLGFCDIVVSIKASDVPTTVTANRLFARESNVPLHLGITEAGLGTAGVAKSAVGLGLLLAEGIGDTIRVSLTDDPAEEVRAGRAILQSLNMISGPQLVSCPTCGRCKVELRPIAEQVQEALQEIDRPIVVAVMGCEVNGPGEAKEADFGLACGGEYGVIFRRGERLRRVKISQAAQELLAEIRKSMTPQ